MIDFVGKPPFLRIALPVAMATMYFHMAKLYLFEGGEFFLHSEGPREQLSTDEQWSWGMQSRPN